MRTQFNKKMLLGALGRLEGWLEEFVPEQEKEIRKGCAFESKYLYDFIEEVFEFDFFTFNKDIKWLKEAIEEIAYKVGASTPKEK